MKGNTIKTGLLLMIMICTGLQAGANVRMQYSMSIDTLQHYVNVTLQATELEGESTLFKMPVWAPGYYLIMDYPVNVVDFMATSGGVPIPVEKIEKNGWLVRHGTQTDSLTVKYQVYANEQSVASAQIEKNRAFLPLNGILMYVEGQKDSEVHLHIDLPSDWQKISTGLRKIGNRDYYAKDFDILYDSPILLGNHYTASVLVDGVQYDFAIENPEGLEKWPLFEDLKKIILTAKRLFGGIPYEQYTFLLLKEGQGGLEHLNSQASFTKGDFNFDNRNDYLQTLSFIAHEYFHCYNVKAIRPVEFWPFDYDKEAFTHTLWFGEGITVYYESKILEMAGIISEEERMDTIGDFIKEIESHEGQKHQSLRQFSYDIFLNFFNWGPQGTKTTVSYYDKGPVIGLLLDIDIQRATNGQKSLDDVMALMFKRFFVEQKRGFTEEELWDCISEIAGIPLSGTRMLVDTTTAIPYDSYLSYIGRHLTEDYRIVK